MKKQKTEKSRKKGIKKNSAKISKKMSFAEIINKNPESVETLFEKGMHCIGCPAAMNETLEEGALIHGLDPDKLVDEINKKLFKKKK